MNISATLNGLCNDCERYVTFVIKTSWRFSFLQSQKCVSPSPVRTLHYLPFFYGRRLIYGRSAPARRELCRNVGHTTPRHLRGGLVASIRRLLPSFTALFRVATKWNWASQGKLQFTLLSPYHATRRLWFCILPKLLSPDRFSVYH